MKRKIAVVLLAAMLVITGFTACSGGNGQSSQQAKDIDIAAVSEQIRSECSFRDELLELSMDVLDNQYKVGDLKDSIEQMSVYVSSSGMRVDELAIFKMKTADDASKMKDVFEDRKESLVKKFEDYVPDEVPQIDKSEMVISGQYAMFVISEDHAKAAEIFNNALQ